MCSVALRDMDEIYLAFKEKVTAYVRGKIGNDHDAEDVISSVFLKISRKIDSFDETKASLSTWIYTITRNTVIDYYKSRKKQLEFMDEMAIAQCSDNPALENELLEQLADALALLRERERDLVILHYYSGYPLKQIAEMMGMSYSNAKVLHAKALSMLRSMID